MPFFGCLCAMLLYGTANPVGYGNEDYNGIYLTDTDITKIVPEMKNVPVKIEHRGGNIGRVISAWKHEVRTMQNVFGSRFRI